jgi:hypothetical protein
MLRTLLLSSILYLSGVTVILLMKPALMFNEDGSWKEFGLSSSEKLTPFPLWLFCIIWALVSYLFVRLLYTESPMPFLQHQQQKQQQEPPTRNLKKGVYVLNRAASEIEGVPRYIYIGSEDKFLDA